MSNARATSTIDLGLPRRSQIGAGPSGVCAAGATEAVGREDWSDEFIEVMREGTLNARVRSAHVLNPPHPQANALWEVHRRLELLKTTGKRDYLIDVAKFAMLAWMKLGGDVAPEQTSQDAVLGRYRCKECGRTVQDTFSVNAGNVYCPACAGLEG